MTGLDALREEMKDRGVLPSQVNSKVVAVVLDILSNSGDKYTRKFEDEKEATVKLTEDRTKITQLEEQIERLEAEARIKRRQIEELEDEKKRSYIAEFNESLKRCETEEGRDAMRRAQVFINSVDIETEYDNYAFIDRLGLILANCKFGDIKELKKISEEPEDNNTWGRV